MIHRATYSLAASRVLLQEGSNRGCTQLPHPAVQHTHGQGEVACGLRRRYASIGYQPHDLCLELPAELPSRHIHSPVPWSRSYRRVHETGRSSYSGRTPEERLHGIRRDTNQQVEKFLVAEETVLSLTALYIAPAGSSEERLGYAASMFFQPVAALSRI